MTGVVRVIDMLGNTIAKLEAELAAEREQNAVLTRMLGDKPAPPEQDDDHRD